MLAPDVIAVACIQETLLLAAGVWGSGPSCYHPLGTGEPLSVCAWDDAAKIVVHHVCWQHLLCGYGPSCTAPVRLWRGDTAQRMRGMLQCIMAC